MGDGKGKRWGVEEGEKDELELVCQMKSKFLKKKNHKKEFNECMSYK